MTLYTGRQTADNRHIGGFGESPYCCLGAELHLPEDTGIEKGFLACLN